MPAAAAHLSYIPAPLRRASVCVDSPEISGSRSGASSSLPLTLPRTGRQLSVLRKKRLLLPFMAFDLLRADTNKY